MVASSEGAAILGQSRETRLIGCEGAALP